MEYRNLDITLISAQGIKNVNLISKMDVYAVVWIEGGDPRAVIRTPVHNNGGTDPTWNFSMKFALDDAAAQQNRLTLVIRLRSQRELGDRDIGEVRVPIKEIIIDNKGEQFVRYQVKRLDGRPKGEVNLSYKFSDKITGEQEKVKSLEEPVTAYPAKNTGSSSGYQPVPTTAYPHAGGYQQPGYPPAGYPPQGAPPVAGYGYPPPQQAYGGYPPPQQAYGGYPPQGYGYPPPQQGYGYAPPMQQPPRKHKFGGGGMGMGMGLLGGALGGMLIGDMISDAGDGAYDAGYDAGFDDAGGDF